ncbi:DNA-binding MarR family transcriptional regulator [Streptosporangium becharense]|uniref:DNA-binding MarR family transcriptional regulator n=1 Tax=Streptosporangium becharense TaxID=1816182 RepID=A0A7W9IH95_9ACTN|nr:MarR family transcriptional regulator [Streptosporangium becharense]MBB2908879.1 DNA-binding MarR family transcriptional regulator [Streptosporangium becharense]MBB5820103.1 DNA-binding MarR family transcriptional regulator [Streptosporangium becharense]
MTRWLDDDEQRTWRAFLAASQRIQEELDRQLLHDSGMPHAYYVVLVRLSEAPGRTLRMSELATQVDSSQSRLSHAVKRLEERGWVRREPCAADRRVSWAVLTDEGFEVLAAAAPGHVGAVRRSLFDRLDSEQVRRLAEICAAILGGDGAPTGEGGPASGR